MRDVQLNHQYISTFVYIFFHDIFPIIEIPKNTRDTKKITMSILELGMLFHIQVSRITLAIITAIKRVIILSLYMYIL